MPRLLSRHYWLGLAYLVRICADRVFGSCTPPDSKSCLVLKAGRLSSLAVSLGLSWSSQCSPANILLLEPFWACRGCRSVTLFAFLIVNGVARSWLAIMFFTLVRDMPNLALPGILNSGCFCFTLCYYRAWVLLRALIFLFSVV